MQVFHVTTFKKLQRYLKTGAILPPVRAWKDIQSALEFLKQTHRHLILVLDFPDGWIKPLPGHKNNAVYIDRPYHLSAESYFSDIFVDFISAMKQKYEEREAKYGNAWENVPIDVLRNKLIEEIIEWKRAVIKGENEKEELIDLANVCMMLWHRLK